MNMLKKFLVLFALSCMACSCCFGQSDRRPNKSELTVATFNAEFLWDGLQPEEGGADFPHKGDPAKADAHMAKIATIIKTVNADIINLVEVENIHAITMLNDKYLVGLGYKPYLINGMDQATGQDVGLLTRIDPTEAIQRYNEKGVSENVHKAVSKNYFAKFNINGNKIALVGLHFLAHPQSPDRKDERQAQADAIASLGQNLASEGFSLFICGDFNDFDGATPDRLSSKPITNVLERIKELDPATKGDNLINAAALIKQTDRYTAFWDKDHNGQINATQEYSSIDHILLSATFSKALVNAYISHQHDPQQVSDHFPVVVKLKF